MKGRSKKRSVAMVLAVLLLVGVSLFAWQRLERATTQEPDGSPSAQEGASGASGSPGQAVDTATLPPSTEEPGEGVKEAPLGTELSPEEMARLKEQAKNLPPSQETEPQEDTAKGK